MYSWDNIKYREAQDKNALYLKILIISLSLFIILLMLSKRYVISMLIGPILIISVILLFLGYHAAAIIVFFIYPLKLLIKCTTSATSSIVTEGPIGILNSSFANRSVTGKDNCGVFHASFA